MTTIAIPNIYTTPYTVCTNDYCVQRTVTIPGETGKITALGELTLNLGVAAKGAMAAAWVTTEVNGVVIVLGNWTEVDTAYQLKTATPGFFGEVGEDIVLKWHLRTTVSSIRAKMKDLRYSYTINAVEETVAECLVVIECENQEEADAIAESLIDKGASVYTRKSI